MTKTIELKKGVEIRVTVELHKLVTEGDTWEGKVGRNDIWTETTYALVINGKEYKCNNACFSEAYLHNIRKLDESVKARFVFIDCDNNVVEIRLTEENANKVKEAVAECEKAESTEEYEAYKAEKAEKELATEKAEAKEVVEAAERIISNGGKLRTNAERKEWERNYNNLQNEGGEGFVPHYPSVEEYKDALETLKK